MNGHHINIRSTGHE